MILRYLPVLCVFAVTAPLHAANQTVRLELKKGDQIAIVGSGLADRQQHHGYLEAMIHRAYPDLELTVRNLGFAADEVNLHPRSDEVPKTEYFLNMKKGDTVVKIGDTQVVYKAGTDFNASVIFAYWGFNESFKGAAGANGFRQNLDAYLKKTTTGNGAQAPPRVVLFSPIAHENLQDANFPDGAKTNLNLEVYTKIMAEVADLNKVPFVDLYHASLDLYAKSPQRLTLNGIHLTETGDRALAPVQFEALFGKAAPDTKEAALEKIRAAVVEKNSQWHHRYRTVDQYNIFGGRSRIKYEGTDNATILGQELAQRDVLTANRDRAVWAAAQGRDYQIKDDNLPPVDLTPPNRKDAVPYLSGEEAMQHITVAEGCKLEFIASEATFPELINPVQMNFDTKGRLWISVWPSYPETSPTTTNFDKLIYFDLDPKTGQPLKCTTFADGLNCPTGFQFYKDGVIVMQSPDLWFLRDTDGDGKADSRERLLHGLDAADSHHETNSICYEPGGAIYLSDGVFHRTNVETYLGPVRNTDGAIYRYEPSTSKFRRHVPYGFANPHGRVFDYWGNDLITDATGNANYFGPGFSGHLDQGSHPGYQQFWDRPSRPCAGTAILTSRHFPESWQGQFLNANVISFQGIFRAELSDEGAGIKGKTVDHLVSTDVAKNPNFRPSGITVAPDGSLYFMDWSQMLIGHLQHHLRDPNRDHQHGRLYRITYPSRPLLEPKKVDGEPIVKLLELLKEPENDVRLRAKIELSKHDSAQVIAATQEWAKQFDPNKAGDAHHLLEALWVHQWHNAVNIPLLETLLKSPEPRARAQAVRVIGYQMDRIPEALDYLMAAANDSAPRVRLEAVRVASFFSGEEAAKAVTVAQTTLKYESDSYLKYTYTQTMRQLDSIRTEKSLPEDPVLLTLVLAQTADKDLDKLPAVAAVLQTKLERSSFDAVAREKAVSDLMALTKTSRMAILLGNLQRLDAKGEGMAAAAAALGRLLPATAPAELAAARADLMKAAGSAKLPAIREAAWSALVVADGKPDALWTASEGKPADREALIASLGAVADPALRSPFQPALLALINNAQTTSPLRKAALMALPLMGVDHAAANFTLLAKFLTEGQEPHAIANAIMQLPRDAWDKTQAAGIAQKVLAINRQVDAKKRSEQSFVELNQLGLEMAALAGNMPLAKELRSLGVSIFVLKTVREQLKYDTNRLVVTAGKPFEVLFENNDVMPHNLVFVDPGQHMAIGNAALTMPPDRKDRNGRAYLPKGFPTLAATSLLEPGQKERLQLTAPKAEGEYEFVCTFPGHAAVMWGRLIVTNDVDAWLAAHPQ